MHLNIGTAAFVRQLCGRECESLRPFVLFVCIYTSSCGSPSATAPTVPLDADRNEDTAVTSEQPVPSVQPKVEGDLNVELSLKRAYADALLLSQEELAIVYGLIPAVAAISCECKREAIIDTLWPLEEQRDWRENEKLQSEILSKIISEERIIIATKSESP